MCYLVIDIGGTSIKSAIYKDRTFINYVQFVINRNNPMETLNNILEKYQFSYYNEILISATGVIDKLGKVINTNGFLKNYLNINIKNFVKKKRIAIH